MNYMKILLIYMSAAFSLFFGGTAMDACAGRDKNIRKIWAE